MSPCHGKDDLATIVEIVDAVTGWGTGIMELLRIQERVITVARLFNIREGFTSDDDKLPQRYFEPKTSGALSERSLNRKEMERALHYFYNLMGWDKKGVPLSEKIEELCIE